jgi:hypothetical protein
MDDRAEEAVNTPRLAANGTIPKLHERMLYRKYHSGYAAWRAREVASFAK